MTQRRLQQHLQSLGKLDLLSLFFKLLVKLLLSALLALLDLVELSFESIPTRRIGHDFFQDSLFPVLTIDPRIEEFRVALDDSSDLRVLRYTGLIFTIMPVRVEDVTVLDDLEVTLELGSKLCSWHIEPRGTSRGRRFLKY